MRWMLVLLVATLGCGGAESRSSSGEQTQVDPEKAKLLINEAKNKIESEDFDKARELLQQANQYSDAKIRHRISLATQGVNEAEAQHYATEINKRAADGKCADALALTAKVVTARADTQVPGQLQQLTGEQHLACASAVLERGDMARARRLSAAATTAKALSGKRLREYRDEIQEAVMTALLALVDGPIKQGRWTEATAKLHQAVEEGTASTADRQHVLRTIRKALSKLIEKRVRKAFGESGAEEALEEVDSLIAAGFWKPRPIEDEAAQMDEEHAQMQKLLASTGSEGKSSANTGAESGPQPTELTPVKLAKLRRELAFWVACNRVRCKDSGPRKAWLYGNAKLHPPFDPLTESAVVLETGRAVWEIARGGGLVLVAKVDPGPLDDLAARAHKGLGWVSATELKTTDTSEWLPPGDSIVGARVWGPLREGAPTWEIGTATAVEGANVQVQRMSDRAVVSLPRLKLRFGVAKKGIKVLAFCEPTKLSPAVIDKVVEPKHQGLGDPKVRVRCLDAAGKPTAKTHEDLLGALRSKPAWLPPRR